MLIVEPIVTKLDNLVITYDRVTCDDGTTFTSGAQYTILDPAPVDNTPLGDDDDDSDTSA